MFKIKNKNGTRDENNSAQRVFSKKTLNYKIITSPENGQPHPFHPTQLPLPHRIKALLAAKAFNVGISNKQLFEETTLHVTPRMCQPILNQSPKDTPLNFTSLGNRLSSHTSLFWTLPEQLSMLHHAFVPTHPEPTSQRYITKPQTVRLSSHTSVWNFAGAALHINYTTHVSQPILNKRPKTHYKLQIRKKIISHILVLNFAGTTRNRLHHACVPTDPEPTFRRHTTKPQTPKCSSHTSLFWTLPEQLSILHHAFVPTLNQRSKDTPQNLRPQDVHLTHPCFELCRSSSPYYTTHVCQPILNQRPKTHYKLQSENFHLTHPYFHLCRNRLHLACVPTLNQCCKATPQNLRPQDFHLTHPSFELCRSSSPYYTTHVCQPILNQCSKTHYKLQSENFHLTHPCFELCRNNSEQMTPRMCANPEPTFQRYSTKPQTLRFSSHTSVLNFAGTALHITPHMWANPSWTNVPKHTTNFRSEFAHLTHPCLELCRNNSEQMTPRMCANPEPMLQRHTTKPQTLRFSSHTSVLNFAGAALHITPHMWANPSWTNVPKHTTNFRSEFVHLTHPFFELCRNSLPCYTTHVSQPILYQRPKIQHND